ncbi:hypothetical protein Q8A67_003197 [Cirrhinus molitorella]|uniref:Uncharacterized protein n=1 Tax=Cirrhinus molitorella TaxID=172907 RepID=A0AA88Q7J5_9TELE|nr:hypothetical protein Q8A67_003197 [Cirrhinus molitorella]
MFAVGEEQKERPALPHSMQEPRGGVIGHWPYLGGAVGGILLIHWHLLRGPSHPTDALPLAPVSCLCMWECCCCIRGAVLEMAELRG